MLLRERPKTEEGGKEAHSGVQSRRWTLVFVVIKPPSVWSLTARRKGRVQGRREVGSRRVKSGLTPSHSVQSVRSVAWIICVFCSASAVSTNFRFWQPGLPGGAGTGLSQRYICAVRTAEEETQPAGRQHRKRSLMQSCCRRRTDGRTTQYAKRKAGGSRGIQGQPREDVSRI